MDTMMTTIHNISNDHSESIRRMAHQRQVKIWTIVIEAMQGYEGKYTRRGDTMASEQASLHGVSGTWARYSHHA
jgi:beta-mannanase